MITPSSSNSCYRIVYTFIAATVTTAPTSVSPVEYISSGNQTKHNDGIVTSVPQILPATNTTTLSKSVSPGVLPNGGTVTYTVTLTNTGSIAVTLDTIRDVLPTGVSYINNSSSSTCTAVAVGNPLISGQT